MKGTLLSGCSWWVKTSSFLYQMELAQAHLTVVDIGIVENTNSNKRFELSTLKSLILASSLRKFEVRFFTELCFRCSASMT